MGMHKIYHVNRVVISVTRCTVLASGSWVQSLLYGQGSDGFMVKPCYSPSWEPSPLCGYIPTAPVGTTVSIKDAMYY